MAQLSQDAFAAKDRPMPVDEAIALLRERVPAIAGVDELPLLAALGRTLAQPLLAPIDLPSFDNSAVDGYGVCFADLLQQAETHLPVSGKLMAGHCFNQSLIQGAAIRIFTGSPVPKGYDTIFMQEDCKLDEAGHVVLPPGLKPGANLRKRGEDLAKGAVAIAQGRCLMPEDLALAAALGVTCLNVRRRLRVAVFSTGDEIVSPGEPLREAGVYDANRFLLQGMLLRLGVDVADLGILRDDLSVIQSALTQAADNYDLVITSGGVSMGEADHVKAAIAAAGSLVFWKLAIKPGRPVAMAVVKGKPFIGLPGNPVAVFITFAYVVKPLIAALSGAEQDAPRRMPVIAGFSYKKKKGRREYVRATLTCSNKGEFVAEKYPVEGAGVLTSLTRTHGLVELSEDVTSVMPGDSVGFIDYDLIR